MRPLPRGLRQAAVRRRSSGPTSACTRSSPSARRRSISTRRARRCSSAAGAATPTSRRCARISPPGILTLAGWTPGTPLLDPMCGAGTIAIEAALVAADIAPGLAAHVRLPEARVVRRTDLAAHPSARARSRPSGAGVAHDLRERHRLPRAVAQCRSNAAAAGVAEWIEIERGRRARARGAGPAGHPRRQSALRRAARRRRERSRRSTRDSATR